MAIISGDDYDASITVHSPHVIEITAVYNNHFIRRVFIGKTYKQAIKQFDEDIKKGKY